MENVNNQGVRENTTNTGVGSPLSQINCLSDAFTENKFAQISFEEFSKDPIVGKIITILYSQSENKLKAAEAKILSLTASLKFFKAFPTANIAFVVMNVIGTLLVGLGAPSNLWIIILGALLVLAGNILPLIFIKKGERL